jgi:tRNA threonylcarbamoyl adenosine modification protein YeaZ/ribosomal-protein-alanine acetyltransferase
MAKGHAEALAPMVEAVMGQAGVPFSALTRIAVTTGPGTFTGLRIALSFARGLGLALKIPVIGFSSLEAMALRAARQNPNNLPILAIIDARREEAYAQSFDAAGNPLSGPAILPLSEITLPQGPTRLIGSGAHLLARKGDETAPEPYPDVGLLALAAETRPDPGHPPHPLYLRPSDAKPQLLLKGQIRLIRTQPEHASVLAALHAESFPHGWDGEFIANILQNPATEGRLALGPDDTPQGFILTTRILDEAEILTIAVHPDARRKGLGSMMLARLSEELGSHGISRLFLDVAENNSPARALYDAAGFAQTGRRRAYYADGDDAILMTRAC